MVRLEIYSYLSEVLKPLVEHLRLINTASITILIAEAIIKLLPVVLLPISYFSSICKLLYIGVIIGKSCSTAGNTKPSTIGKLISL